MYKIERTQLSQLSPIFCFKVCTLNYVKLSIFSVCEHYFPARVLFSILTGLSGKDDGVAKRLKTSINLKIFVYPPYCMKFTFKVQRTNVTVEGIHTETGSKQIVEVQRIKEMQTMLAEVKELWKMLIWLLRCSSSIILMRWLKSKTFLD